MKIVVTERNLAPHRAALETGLPPGSEVVWTSGAAELEAEVGDAEVLVSSRTTPAIGALGKQLRLVHVVGAGYEGIDVASLRAGAQVANTFHHEDSMAEYVLAATIMLRRGFLRQHVRLAGGRWDSPAYDPASPWTNTLEGASVGFVGFGHIGSRAWDGLKAFGAIGHAATRRGDVDASAHGLRWTGSIDDLPQLLDEADVLVLSAPLTETTTG
ncbi:MAG: NAD(P)-dependent oxidoreductase, partial [Nocardioidaceae bacterium]